MKKPRRTPAKTSSRWVSRKIRGRNKAMQIPASVKRSARNTNTEDRSSEFLTTTNVEPQRSVHNASASSARSRCGSDGPADVERTVRQAYQHYVVALFPNPAGKGL